MTIFSSNICNNAETKTVKVKGTPTLVTNFSVAENYVDAAGERQTQFYRIALWRDKGAKLAQYLTKGRSIGLQGRVRGRGYLTQEIVDQIKAGADWKKLTIPCQLEMSNPQITFHSANPTAEVDAVVETAPEDEIPATEEPF